MSSVIYYSKFCNYCNTLIQKISRSKIKEELNYLCVDNRTVNADGTINIVLENGKEIPLPTSVSKVPCILLINKNNQVLFGNQNILNYLQLREKILDQEATQNNGEPSSFSLKTSSGIMSDSYSFLNDVASSSNYKTDGGSNQMHHYCDINYISNIDTPPDDYVSTRIK